VISAREFSMSLNDTPSGERLRISFFGKRNAGKSSLVNAVTGQELAVVSDTLGTTTDPVSKAMELLPLGPVVITDTPGFDDSGELGELRVRKTKQILNKTDIAVLVTDASRELDASEQELIDIFKNKNIPYVVVKNKMDLVKDGVGHTAAASESAGAGQGTAAGEIYVSATEKTNIYELKELIGKSVSTDGPTVRLVGDVIEPEQTIVLVIPIDESAPKGRLILPQQQAIRDILEAGAYSVSTRETELDALLKKMNPKPDLVITDSQAFELVSKIVPEDIKLTSFSILMARYKGFLDTAVRGAAAIDKLQDGDKILISEGCTHHRQCGDIGTVKLPRFLKQKTGKELQIVTSSGTEFPEDLSEFSLIIHCGGCMLTSREMIYRMKCAEDAGIPFTNYGVAIAFMKGILHRSLGVLPELQKLVDPEA
jgi:[FeFe] hydrogenase H-cluster maturation GTPase HydF